MKLKTPMNPFRAASALDRGSPKPRVPHLLASALSRLGGLSKLGALAAGAIALSGCLDRPIGTEQPRTTNVLVDTLVQSSVDKIDLLFVVDNSISMADKQAIMALAVPDLVRRLVSPVCVEGGVVVDEPASSSDRCSQGAREFNPINDIHIGIVTSSLGGFGAEFDCKGLGGDTNPDNLQSIDMGRLLGSLPRGAAAAASASTTGFLSWTASSNAQAFGDEFRNLVAASGEYGCGWEATLESWYRFLVEPFPYTQIVRQPCNNSDTANSCAGPAPANDGGIAIDDVILQQRKQFLRPNSLLAVIMLTDENDCSFKASGQTWRLSQSQASVEGGTEVAYYPAFRGTDACNNPEFGPNHTCCHSCGQANVPGGCPTATDAQGNTVAVGCENGRKFTIDDTGDHPNLRCFDQKRRFGVDYLYPTARYSAALSQPMICPYTDTLTQASCEELGASMVPNPIYSDLTYVEGSETPPAVPRPQGLVFLAGILGVPWQDVAVDPDAQTLEYRVNRGDAPEERRINWDWILGPDVPAGVPRQPVDPLMRESVAPRSGTNPATGEAVAPPGSDFDANSINGHEWNIVDESDLQYACVFPLPEDKPCPSKDEADAIRDTGASVPNCDCTDYPGDEWQNPLCQSPGGEFDSTQRRAKAYPGLRELEVLKAYGSNSIVASICPKRVDDTNAPDFGYRPAVRAIIDRLKEQLADQCLSRSLTVKDGEAGREAACKIIEAKRLRSGEAASCNADRARKAVEEAVDPIARQELEDKGLCKNREECNSYQLCEIIQLTSGGDQGAYESCLTQVDSPRGDGWCYIDPAKGIGSEELVEKCPDTAKRKLRFVGAGTPESNTITLYACAGEAFDEVMADMN